jgi:hypothetical protein
LEKKVNMENDRSEDDFDRFNESLVDEDDFRRRRREMVLRQLLELEDDIQDQKTEILLTIEAESLIQRQRVEWLSTIKTALLADDLETVKKYLAKYLGIEDEGN